MDRMEIFFIILITSIIQSMAFPVQTETYGDYEMNESVRSASPQRGNKVRSNTSRTLPDSPDQIDKMKSIIGALMKSEKPAAKDNNVKQLNSLLKILGSNKKSQKKQKTKKRNAGDRTASNKSIDDKQNAGSKMEEEDVVSAGEPELPLPEAENTISPEDGNVTSPKEENSEPSDGENLTLPKEDLSKSKERNSEPPEGNAVPPEEVKLAPPKEEKEKVETKEQEEISEAQPPLKKTIKGSSQSQNRIDKNKKQKVHFKVSERKIPKSTAESADPSLISSWIL